MKKYLITIFAIAVTIIAMASSKKVWMYSHSGNHLSMDIADFDSLSFVEPGFLEISPIEKKIGNEGGRFTLNITANKPWTASSNDPAVILGTTQGAGNAKIACTASPNAEEDPYTAIITVTLEDGTYKQTLVTVGIQAELSINKTSLSLEVGEVTTLTVSNYSGTVEWKTSDATVASITPSNGADFKVKGVRAGTATVTATNNGKRVFCVVTVAAPGKEPAPEIAVPGAGLTTLAIRVPSGTCNGAYAIGDFENKSGVSNGWKHNVDGFAFEKVADTETWYAFTFKNDESFEALKVCALPQEGFGADWKYQWGRNTGEKENVTLVVEDADVVLDDSENNGEVKLTAAPANKVIYIDIDAWMAAPCAPVNPAGPASFDISIDLGNLAPVEVKVVGSWDGESEYGNWDVTKGLLLTKTAGKWTASNIEVPKGFQFKVLVAFEEGAEFTWESTCLAADQKMALDNNFVASYTAEDFLDVPVEE